MKKKTAWRVPLALSLVALVASATANPGTETTLATMSSTRDTDGAPPGSYPKSYDKCDYLSYIQQELVGSHLTSIESAKDGTSQASNAGYFALWTAYYFNLQQASDYSQCPDATLDDIPLDSWTYSLIDASTVHWNPPNGAPPAVGSEELARAARTYWLLNREASPVPYPTTNGLSGYELATIREWLLALESARAATDGGFKPGPLARSVGEGLFLEACSMVLQPSDDPLRQGKTFAQRASDHWDAWHVEGDLTEDASNYLGFDAAWLTWWIDLKGQTSLYNEPTKMAKLAYRLRDYATPLGPIPYFGDGAGFAQNLGSYLGAFERWSVAYQDPTFSWVAQRMFQYALERDSDLETLFWGQQYRQVVMQGAMGAALAHGGTAIPASPPSTGTDLVLRKGVSWTDYIVNGQDAVPRMSVTSTQVPDKLVFRTGWGPSDTFAMFNLYPSAGHSHPEAGALVAYTSRDAVLMGGAAPYVNRDPNFHNAFTIVPEAEVSETPDNFQAHQTGAESPSFTVNDTSISVTIDFDAVSVEGSRFLAIRRSRGTLFSAPELAVQLDRTWKHYTVEIDLTPFPDPFDSYRLMFALVEDYQEDRVAKGTFLIDEVVVTYGAAQLGNWQFTSNTDGFGSGNTSSAQLSHRAAANCLRTGFGGCLETRLSTNVNSVRKTRDVSVSTYAAHDDFGTATVHLEEHLGLPLAVDRHIMFLGHDGLWVKDVAEANAAFDGRLGPVWMLGDSKDTQSLSQGAWFVGAQPSVPIITGSPGTFLVHWTNRPKDLLVSFSSPGTTSHREDASLWGPTSTERNNAAYRISRRRTGQVTAGQSFHFNSLLVPHAPRAAPENLANRISWLTDDEDLTVIEVEGDNLDEVIVAGFNHTGGSVSLSSIGMTTDAEAFRIVLDGNGIVSYDLVQATELLLGTLVLESRTSPEDIHRRGGLRFTKNSSLDTGTTDWTGYLDSASDGTLISHETTDTSGGSAGAVRWAQSLQSAHFSHQTGAGATLLPIDAFSGVEVTFDAKLVSPIGRHINVQRAYGGSGRVDLPADGTWSRFRANLDTWYNTTLLMFAPVASTASGPFPTVVDGDIILDNVDVRPIPNRLNNPDMEVDISGWSAVGGAVAAHETTDGVFGSASVRGTLSPPPANWFRHNAGVTATIDNIPANSRVHVGFWAKSLSGSTILNVQRPWDFSPGASVTLTSNWAYYDVAFDVFHNTSAVLFNTCGTAPCGILDVVAGEFLLDGVVVSAVTNRIVNGSLSDDLHGWTAYLDGAPEESLVYWDAVGALDVDIAGFTGTSPNDTQVCVSLHDADVYHGDHHHISLSAQSLSGSDYLWIGTPSDNEVVQLTSSLANYQVDLAGPLSEVCFSTVLDAGSGAQTLQSGRVLLDSVVVTSAP